MIVDEDRLNMMRGKSGSGIQQMQFLDTIIALTDENTFYYVKNRMFGIVGDRFPMEDLPAHERILKSFYAYNAVEEFLRGDDR